MKFSKVFVAIYIDTVDIADKDLFHPSNFDCHRSFHTFWTGANSQIMKEFPLINLKRIFIYFVSYGWFFGISKHSLWALHVVLHDIFKMWNAILIHNIEVNILACADTELLGSIELINVALASIFELIVNFPGLFLQNFVKYQLEEYDLIGTLSQ